MLVDFSAELSDAGTDSVVFAVQVVLADYAPDPTDFPPVMGKVIEATASNAISLDCDFQQLEFDLYEF